MRTTQRLEPSGETHDREPTDAELAAIEAEWPQIEAELELLDAQITALTTRQETGELAWRRLRRTQRRVLRTHPTQIPDPDYRAA